MWRIEVLRDELEEAEETLTVVLAEPGGAAIGSVSEAQVAIMETDGKREAASSCGVWCDPSSWMECFSSHPPANVPCWHKRYIWMCRFYLLLCAARLRKR